MVDVLDQARQRALRYWVEDGIPDLYIGSLLLLFVGLRLLARWADAHRQATLTAAGLFGSLAVILAGSLWGRFIIDAVKQRVTYPRTGYVAYAPPSREERRKSLLFTLLFALLLIGMVLLHPQARLPLRMWVFHGVVFLVALAVSLPLRSLRYLLYTLSIPFMAAGYALTWERWPLTVQRLMTYGELTFLALGVWMTIWGAFTLARYLNRYSVFEEVQE